MLAATCTLAADVSSAAAATTNIGNLPSYTMKKGDTALVKVGIWPYFTANGLTDPNSMFPDNVQFTASGQDHGDCRNEFVLGQPICANYRFRCMAAIPDSPVNEFARIFLVDLNAEALNAPGDPQGTCYASEMLMPNGRSTLVLHAFIAAERQRFAQDIQATRGLIEFLAGGSAALLPNSAGITFVVQFNPRPTDPQTFTIAGFDANIRVKQAFSVSMNSEWYPNLESGQTLGVWVNRAK
jgi:hypothetical protein